MLTWRTVLRLSRDLRIRKGEEFALLLPPAPFLPSPPASHSFLTMTPSSRTKDKATDIDIPILSSVPSFHLFLQLPREITDRIITLACRSPSPTIPAYKDSSLRSPLALDVETTLSLARVSQLGTI